MKKWIGKAGELKISPKPVDERYTLVLNMERYGNMRTTTYNSTSRACRAHEIEPIISAAVFDMCRSVVHMALSFAETAVVSRTIRYI